MDIEDWYHSQLIPGPVRPTEAKAALNSPRPSLEPGRAAVPRRREELPVTSGGNCGNAAEIAVCTS